MAHSLTRRRFCSGALALAGGIMPGMTSAQGSPGTLILQAAELHELVASESTPPRILDASPLRTWRNQHLPGATHVFWQDTIDANYPVYGAVVTQGFEQQQRLEVIRRFGVVPSDTIVVYDDVSGFRAARVVWFLRLLGFVDVAMLDGGLSAWQSAGGAVESGASEPPAVEPIVVPQEGFYVVTEALAARLERGDTDVVDIRSPDERHDTFDGDLPLGKIPGSRAWPWTDMIEPGSDVLRPGDTLADQVANLGVSRERDIVVYGRYGVETGLSWLVLRSLGYERVLTYDRGWVEWASTPGTPIYPLP